MLFLWDLLPQYIHSLKDFQNEDLNTEKRTWTKNDWIQCTQPNITQPNIKLARASSQHPRLGSRTGLNHNNDNYHICPVLLQCMHGIPNNTTGTGTWRETIPTTIIWDLFCAKIWFDSPGISPFRICTFLCPYQGFLDIARSVWDFNAPDLSPNTNNQANGKKIIQQIWINYLSSINLVQIIKHNQDTLVCYISWYYEWKQCTPSFGSFYENWKLAFN